MHLSIRTDILSSENEMKYLEFTRRPTPVSFIYIYYIPTSGKGQSLIGIL